MNTSIPESRLGRVISWGQPAAYEEALQRQYELVRRRQIGEIDDTLLLLEHTPTITLGRGSLPGDLLSSETELDARGITVVNIDRGGEITYHAPGQIVGYPILDLRQHGQDLHRYLRDLEEVLIRVIGTHGIRGYRLPGLTGVWVDEAKIAAMGIKVSRWVSMHGFALNIDLDLTPMRRDFIPCGIRDRGVTSLKEQLGDRSPSRAAVEAEIITAFGEIFHLEMRPITDDLPVGLGIMGE